LLEPVIFKALFNIMDNIKEGVAKDKDMEPSYGSKIINDD